MIETRQFELDPDSDIDPDAGACWRVWREMRGAAELPAWSAFDWFAFPITLLPYFVVVDVIDGGADFRYRFWGSAHSRIFHRDYTGASVADVRPAEVADGLITQYRRIMEIGGPGLFVFEVVDTARHRVPIRESSLRLPFTLAGGAIGRIVSFSDNRRQADDFAEFFAKASGAG